MKARTTLALVALILIAGRTQAGGVDKAKLRKQVELPTVRFVVGINYSTTLGIYFNGNKPDPQVEIAQLRKQLKGDASDAERYLRLDRLYSKAGRVKEADAASAKAIALCRQQVREHPDDMRWLALLGGALIHNDKFQEGEKLLRRAVKEAPNEWRAWLALAECVDMLAMRAILGDKNFSFHSLGEKLLSPAIFEKKPAAAKVAEMRRQREEAQRCYARAIELAPRETKPYFRRFGSSWMHAAVEASLRAGKGKKLHTMAAILTPECASDINGIARLSPDDPKTVGLSVLLQILTGITHTKKTPSKDPPSFEEFLAEKRRSLLDKLPPENRKAARWGMERLEQLAKNSDKATAAAASEILAEVLVVIIKFDEDGDTPFPGISEKKDGFAKILDHLRRAVQLDPSRDRAWDMLTVLLATHEKTSETLAVSRQRVKIKDNAHNRFWLAKAYVENDQFPEAAKQLRAGVKNDSKDLDCRIGLIAALLMRDDAAALKEAGEQLDAVEPLMKEEKSKQRAPNYLLLRGIHAALSGRSDRAKESFKQVLRLDKGEKKAARAFAALGEPLTPDDRQMAIDYLLAREGTIERADKRPEAAVVKVHLTDDKIRDDDLFYLTVFSQLRELNLCSKSITDAGLPYVAGLTTLRELALCSTKITDKGLSRLKSLTNLRGLDLSNTWITDAGLAHLAAFPKLERISLPGLPWYRQEDKQETTEAGLAHLRKLPNLRDVSINTTVTDKGLAHLAALPKLQKLSISDGKITDEGMKFLGQCKQLRNLWLNNEQLTDAELAHLKGLRHLRELHLSHTKITGAGLVHLKGLTNLEVLDLSNSAITDAGLASLSELTNLRELNLTDFLSRMDAMMDEAFQSMPRFPGEKRTPPKKPAKPRLTDAGLKHLRGLTKLKILDLNGRPITDAGLTQLAELKNLHQLLVGSTKVTGKGVAELRKVIPQLEVSR